jgi:NifU-like protein involved in Fe-S cluster formation
MTAAYPEGFLDHFRRPRNVGALEAPDRTWEGQSPHCRDFVRFTARLRGNRLEAIRFQAYGCSVCIAAASAATVAAEGKTMAHIQRGSAEVLTQILGAIPDRKRRCVEFVWNTLREGLLTKS